MTKITLEPILQEFVETQPLMEVERLAALNYRHAKQLYLWLRVRRRDLGISPPAPKRRARRTWNR